MFATRDNIDNRPHKVTGNDCRFTYDILKVRLGANSTLSVLNCHVYGFDDIRSEFEWGS